MSSQFKNYEQDLQDRLRDIKQKIKEQEAVIEKLPTAHPTFMDEYEKLNLLRITQTTIESRQQNRKYFPGGYEPAEIIINQPNNNNYHD